MKLEGRVAIVTGAAQGIGRAIAEKLREEGATSPSWTSTATARAAVAATLDGLAIRPTSRARQDAQRMATETLARYGRIDVLVNAAAIVPFIPWDEVDFAYWRKIISVNLDGAYLVSRAVEAADARGRLRAHRPHRLERVLCRAPRTWAPTSPPRAASSG